MFNNDVKSALLECLNENIKQEDVFLRYRLYEQVAGSTAGSTGSAPAPAGSTGTSPSPAGTTGSFPTSPVTPGPPPTGVPLTTSPVTPGGSPLTPTPMTRITGGTKGGRGSGINITGNTADEEIDKEFTKNIDTFTGALGDAGGLLGIYAGLNTLTSTLGLIPGLSTRPIVGQVYRNLLNIIPNQEALRKEGLGYTKGFARMAD